MKKFALIGVGGYVAPRHLKAIKDTGNTLVAALDKHDSVAVMDDYFPEAHFFTEFERFDRHLEKQKRIGQKVDFVSVCSPNYLHDAHVRFGLRLGADVICEKPIVLNPWNIDALAEIEMETGNRVFTILQLRHHPAIIALKKKVEAAAPNKKFNVNLQYITSRGRWYQHSWKGDIQKSGGIATNIGVHFFDMLIWVFGNVVNNKVLANDIFKASGELELENANINWTLSIDENDLPVTIKVAGKRTFRSLTINEEAIEFSDGFSDLHIQSYAAIIAGNGFSLLESRKAIELVARIRGSKV